MRHLSLLEVVGLLSLLAIAIYIYENYKENQRINPEEERLFSRYSDAYRDLSVDFRSNAIDRATFEKKKREILNNSEEKRKVTQKVERKNDLELASKERFKKKRIVGYKYDEFIFDIFYDKHELTWNELLIGIQNTFNLPSLDSITRDEYYENDEIPEDDEILNIWFDNSLIEICKWSEWNAENPRIIEHFKVGDVLKQRHYQINDYDITHSVWLEDRNITLKHCAAYDFYMSIKS